MGDQWCGEERVEERGVEREERRGKQNAVGKGLKKSEIKVKVEIKRYG